MRIEKITSSYKVEESTKKKRLEDNLKEQKRLRERLAELEEQETRLGNEIRVGESQDSEAVEEKAKVVSEVEEWKEKVEELRRRAETSLMVMKEMSGESQSSTL